MHVGVCIDVSFQFLWLNKQGAWLLCYTIRLCLVLWLKPSSQVAVHFSVPSNSLWDFCSTSPALAAPVWACGFQPSNRCVIVPHCFNFSFIMTNGVEHVFMCLFSVCMSFLNEVSVCIFCPFCNLLFPYCCLRGYCVPWILVLYQTCVLRSLSVACHFILFTVTFAEQSF